MFDSVFEEKWFEEKNKSVGHLVTLIKKAPAILKKYKFDKIQSEIISKLLKSNDDFWRYIEESTEQSRKVRTVIDDIEEKVNTLTEKILKEKVSEFPNQDVIDMLMGELEYIKDNFDPDTNILVTYEEVNKDYDDTELVFFFIDNAEKIDKLLENTMNKEGGFFNKDELFLGYFLKLFALSMNNFAIEIKDTEIVLKAIVDEQDFEAFKELSS